MRLAPRMRSLSLLLFVVVLTPLFGACADEITAPREVGRRAGIYMLPELEVPTCRYGGDYPACHTGPSPEGTGINPGTEDSYTPEGGGSEMPPPDSTDEKPCNTSDPVLNSLAVQAGFEDLWSRSNPDAEMSQRREKGGWIIQSGTAYVFEPWPDSWTIGPCGLDLPETTTAPAGAIGYVHTHPYKRDELLTSCDHLVLTFGNGQTMAVYEKYKNAPSDPDGEAASRWGIAGYIIDKNRITRYVGTPTGTDKYRVTAQHGRCGY